MSQQLASHVLETLKRSDGPLCDDCLAQNAGFRYRQQAHYYAGKLADTGVISRGHAVCSKCRREKLVSWPAEVTAPDGESGAVGSRIPSFLDAWRSKRSMEKRDWLPLIRRFCLDCGANAARRYGVSEAGMDRIIIEGTITDDQIEGYGSRQLSVEGLRVSFKRFKQGSEPMDSLSFAVTPAGQTQWFIGLRVSMGGEPGRHHISEVTVALYRYFLKLVHIDEDLVRECAEAWRSLGENLRPLDPRKPDNEWGLKIGVGDWSGNQDELAEYLGERIAVLLPILDRWHQSHPPLDFGGSPPSAIGREDDATEWDADELGLDQILSAFAQSDLIYDDADLVNLHHALRALDRKHFVILHGVSGTGKSQFAQAYANALYGRPLQAPNNPYYLLAPVQPTWQDRTPLLGYYNPIDESYVQPSFLQHVLKAAGDEEHAYIVCLDEMNLAVVEHYLADFLSAWESGEAIPLHGLSEEALGVPRELPIPTNLMVIGTVNMDETTHGFSPKVLDRAFTVELSRVDVQRYAERVLAKYPEYADTLRPALAVLEQLNSRLVAHGLHFAYRTMDEICRFLVTNTREGGRLPNLVALDLMVAQKVLPKFRGDDRQRDMLDQVKELLQAALGPHPSGGEYRSLQALERMIEDVRFGAFQFWR